MNEISTEESSGDELKVNEVCQEVRDGETIIIITQSILILVTATILATVPNKTSLKTADKVSSGDRNQKTPKSH